MYKVDIDYIKLFIMNAYKITKVPIVIHLSKFADEVTSEYVNEMYNDIIEANGHDTIILINERGSVNTKLITNNTLYPYVYIYYSGNHEYVLSNVEKHF